MITIAVDAMGGDRGCEMTVPAAVQLLQSDATVRLILLGDRDKLESAIKTVSSKGSEYLQRLEVRHASQQIEMTDSPSKVIRGKRDSSMHRAIELVAEGEAHACISAGNTGALVAISCLKIRTIAGIDRPALISCFPTLNRERDTRILDLGATIQQSASSLVQLAVMGSVLLSEVDGVVYPKVALLNIGTEEIKGNEEIKLAAKKMAGMSQLFEYTGFIESDAIFRGEVDLVVCDGFVGNVALKTLEGSMYLIAGLIKQQMRDSLLAKFGTCLAMPLLRHMRRSLDPAHHNGASLLGLNGVVIKSHGGASSEAFLYALKKAVREAKRCIPEKIGHRLAQIMLHEQKIKISSE